MKRPIKVEDRVTTADGTIATVRYVGPKWDSETNQYTSEPYAELSPEGGGETLTLPVAELKRVPKTARPPIEDMPPERPRCPFCGSGLRPVVQGLTAAGNHAYGRLATRRAFVRWDGYAISAANHFDKFCTLACARAFANAAYLAGYRIKPKGGQ